MVNAPAVTSRIEIGMDIIDQLLETSPDNPNLEGQIEEHLNALAEPPRTRFNLDNLEKASMVTKSFRNPHLKMSRPNFSSDKDRVLTYELVVAILKCMYKILYKLYPRSITEFKSFKPFFLGMMLQFRLVFSERRVSKDSILRQVSGSNM